MTEKKAKAATETVTIHIDKADAPQNPIRGGVNGRQFEVPAGKPIEVAAWIARALRDSNINFTIVKGSLGEDEGDAEGSASPSSDTLDDPTGTKDTKAPTLTDQGAGEGAKTGSGGKTPAAPKKAAAKTGTATSKGTTGAGHSETDPAKTGHGTTTSKDVNKK